VIVVLSGGVGAARFLSGLVQVVDPAEITAVVNTGDDTVLHGLHISPDIDTVTYTLAGAVNPVTGWGLTGETWAAMSALERLGGASWFRLGDGDLGTHLYRTGRLAEGATLSEVTAEVARAWNLSLRIVPVTNDRLRTRLRLVDGEEVEFQDYFVRLRHSVPVSAVRFDGAAQARPAPGVLEALGEADLVVVAPSNPVVSIAPIVAVPGVREVLESRRESVVAISPIIAGAALKGPADRLLTELTGASSVTSVARLISPWAATLVIDVVDKDLVGEVEAEGVHAVVAPTVMHDRDASAELARAVLAVHRR